MQIQVWRNKKTGNDYFLLYKGIDTTNSRDGTEVCIYEAVDYGNSSYPEKPRIFVREASEFFEKFELLTHYNYDSTEA